MKNWDQKEVDMPLRSNTVGSVSGERHKRTFRFANGTTVVITHFFAEGIDPHWMVMFESAPTSVFGGVAAFSGPGHKSRKIAMCVIRLKVAEWKNPKIRIVDAKIRGEGLL